MSSDAAATGSGAIVPAGPAPRAAALDVSHLPPRVSGSRALLWWGNVWMFAIEGTMFALLAATYFYLRLNAAEWPPPTVEPPGLLVPTLGLLILLLSCYPVHEADKAVVEGNRRKALVGMAIGIMMGLVFLTLRILDWRSFNFTWSDHAYGSIVWTILGFHTGHFVAATVESLVVAVYLARRPLNEKGHLYTEVEGLYWYFVVGVWIPLYAIIYLIR